MGGGGGGGGWGEGRGEAGGTELMSLGSNDAMTNNLKNQFPLWNNVGEQTLFA